MKALRCSLASSAVVGALGLGAHALAQDGAWRERIDPFTGARWALSVNQEQPGRPGRWRLLEEGEPSASHSELRAAFAPRVLAVRSGERVWIHRETSALEATYEAQALGPAAVGEVFAARLELGGRRVRARLTGPGRAEYLEDLRGTP